MDLMAKPEAVEVLSVAPSTATSGSRGIARSIQRQLQVQFDTYSTPPDTIGVQLPAHPPFDWTSISAGKLKQLPEPASICRTMLLWRTALSSQCSGSPGWSTLGSFQRPISRSDGARLITCSSGLGKVWNCRRGVFRLDGLQSPVIVHTHKLACLDHNNVWAA